MHDWAKDLFPICRSITGPGVRETLGYIKGIVPELNIHQIKSGTKIYDWVIPDEWSITDAFVKDHSGKKIIDYKKNNLHVINYSIPINKKLKLNQIIKHIYSIPDQPNAIPYMTSYYNKYWGFCLQDKIKKTLKSGNYHAYIDSKHYSGVLNYADVVIPGKSKQEIFFSTYICHPSMANNELSGPVVATALIKWLTSINSTLRYTYRFVFVPETIGSICYLSKNLNHLKKYVVAGFNLTCLGDELNYSFVPSRTHHTLADKVALHVLKNTDPKFNHYTWLERGSDERQYCAPGIDLPVVNMMRSKPGSFPEYHTSLDDLNFITPTGLKGGYKIHKDAINILENNHVYKCKTLGEPQLGKRGLRPQLGQKDNLIKVKTLMNLLSYCDGNMTVLEIAEKINESFNELEILVNILIDNNLLEKVH